MISFLNFLDADDFLAEMRMERQAFKGSFILIEGETDFKRFEKFIDCDVCSFVNCYGKAKLLKTVTQLNKQQFHDFVAFVDADFDRVLGTILIDDNIIYSEGHDFEIDTIHTNAWERYLKEVVVQEYLEIYCNIEDISMKIAEGILPLSRIKLINIKGNVFDGLKNINFSNYFDGFSLDFPKFFNKILKSTSKNQKCVDKIFKLINKNSKCVDKIFNIIEKTFKDQDIWQITNGHDFFTALGVCLQHKIAKRNRHQTIPKEIEMHIRLALSEADFKSMNVYNNIIAWQEKSSRSILKEHLA